MLANTEIQSSNPVAGDEYVNSSPKPNSGEKKKIWIAIIACILAIVALIAICVSTAILGPELNDSSSSTTKGNNNAAGFTATDTSTTGSNVEIENYYTYDNITKYHDCGCQCSTETYGVLNAGQMYEVGGYYGWEYSNSYPDLYPFTDLHVSIGDRIIFKARDWTPDDVWLVTEDVFDSCDWSVTTNLRQLANNNEVRGDCDDKPWLPCGFEFLAQEWHIENYGMFTIWIFLFYIQCTLYIKSMRSPYYPLWPNRRSFFQFVIW